MMSYVPKLWDAVVTGLICIPLLAIGAGCEMKGWSPVANSFYLGALLFAVLTGMVVYMLVVQTWGEYLERQIRFGEMFHLLDDEGRRALSFVFPSMRYRMRRGVVRAEFEDTGVSVELFREFMRRSNTKYIAPRREWFTSERPEWAWEAIKGWLEHHDRVIPDSAAGSHSWLWNGDAYQQLMAYWMSGRELSYPSESRSYAYDLPPSPPREEVGEGAK